MKKLLMCLTVLLSFIGVSTVSAESLYLEDSTDVNFIPVKEKIGSENFNFIVNDILDLYKNTYMESYPYFYVSIVTNVSYDSPTYSNINLDIYLNASTSIPSLYWIIAISGDVTLTRFKETEFYIKRTYPVTDNDSYVFDLSNYTETISLSPDSSGWYQNLFDISNYLDDFKAYYSPYEYYLSNFDLTLPSIPSEYRKYDYMVNYDSLGIPKLGEEKLYSVVSFDRNDYLIEPYYLYDTDVDISISNIEEINLNDYAYVALSLKDYNQEPFSTTVQVQGQYCLTPVYNYGMTERKDILTGSQVERCSPYYDTYTPVRTYILDSDLKNNAIYYLKSYDTSKDNYVKVDTNVFDITYITEENKDNPYVTIAGKTYPTIAYDDLSDSATKSEDEDYISGASKEFNFSDIFTAPLDYLQDIWSTIVTFFTLITSFISLLPAPLQAFLYASFTLAIALGLIKIIL